MTMWEIHFFELSNGRCPAVDFIDDLDPKQDQVYVERLLDQLKAKGNELLPPHVKNLGGGIYELRVQTINLRVRLFYFFYDKNQIIITNGTKKKKPRVPHEIELARKYRKLYYERVKNEI